MKCGTDVDGAKRTKPNDFGELLAFSGAPPSGQSSQLFCEITKG